VDRSLYWLRHQLPPPTSATNLPNALSALYPSKAQRLLTSL